MAPIPDSPCGLRFCRDCNEFKPIGEFPKGKRRYQCRKHVEERCKQWRRRAGVSKNVLAKVWHAAYMDARAVFQRKVTKLSQADVARLFAEDGVEPAVSFRALPADPNEVISVDNAILVSMDDRKRLVRDWTANEDAARYREMVLQLQGRDLVR